MICSTLSYRKWCKHINRPGKRNEIFKMCFLVPATVECTPNSGGKWSRCPKSKSTSGVYWVNTADEPTVARSIHFGSVDCMVYTSTTMRRPDRDRHRGIDKNSPLPGDWTHKYAADGTRLPLPTTAPFPHSSSASSYNSSFTSSSSVRSFVSAPLRAIIWFWRWRLDADAGRNINVSTESPHASDELFMSRI